MDPFGSLPEHLLPPPPPGRAIAPAVLLAFAAGIGVVTDVALSGAPGIGLVVAVVLASAALIALTLPSRASIVFLVAGVVTIAGVAVRASPVVTLIDLAIGVSLVALGAAFALTGDPFTATARAYGVRAGSFLRWVPTSTAALASPLVHGAGRSAALRRTLVLIVPVAGVLVLLLGSADPVFAHYLGAPLRAAPEELPIHAGRTVVAAIAFAALTTRALRPVDDTRASSPLRLPWDAGLEWIALVMAVTTVTAAFVLVQLATMFGGAQHVLDQEGLTYAEYARTGFWQMLASAGIAGTVIAGAWIAGARRGSHTKRRAFTWAALILVATVVVILVSAFRRLALYEEAYGFTWPRLLGHTAVVALGVLILCGGVAIATGHARWLPVAGLGVLVVTALALTWVDPERFIAERNLDRYHRSGEVDIGELAGLSPDAAPTLVAALPTLEACDRMALHDRLAAEAEALGNTEAGASWNAARDRARAALEGLPPIDDITSDC